MFFRKKVHDIGELPRRFDTISVSRKDLAKDLENEQETDLAKRVAKLPDEQYIAIMQRARFYAFNYSTPGGNPILWSVAFALATVEVVEGQLRPLARKRRYVYSPVDDPGQQESEDRRG